MREDAGEVGEESLVDGEEALGANRLLEAVEDAVVEVPVLVVEAGHEGVCHRLVPALCDGDMRGTLTRRVHEAADHETTDGTTREMQRGPLLHAEVPHQPPLGEEVRRQLH